MIINFKFDYLHYNSFHGQFLPSRNTEEISIVQSNKLAALRFIEATSNQRSGVSVLFASPPGVDGFNDFLKTDPFFPLSSDLLNWAEFRAFICTGLNTFIIDICKKQCYGFQTTINKHRGFKYQPLHNFLVWLKTIGIKHTTLDSWFPCMFIGIHPSKSSLPVRILFIAEHVIMQS